MFLENNLLIAVIGALVGAGISQFLNTSREKTLLSFDMHRELNNAEMSQCRQTALEVIKRFPNTSYKDISTKDKEGSVSIFILLRFFQRLSQAVKYKQISKSLTTGLFSEIFYYWYFMSYEKNLIQLDWEAATQIKYLDAWFTKKIGEETRENLRLKIERYYLDILKS